MKRRKDQQQWAFGDGEGYADFLQKALTDTADRDVSAYFDAESPWYHVGVVHYLLRATIVLHRHAKTKHVKEWLVFSQQCLDVACATGPTLADSQGAGLPLPKWAEISRTSITSALRNNHPSIDDVRLVTTTEARLHARSFHSRNTIQVSALMREYLRTFNLCIWNTQFGITENLRKLNIDIELTRFVRVFIEHVITLYRNASPSSMAVIRAYSPEAFHWTQITTGIQLNFILAHEYAHIVLHGNTVGRDPQQEADADAFAATLLLGEPFRGAFGPTAGDIWMALDWLFGFIELERIAGAALNDYPIDWEQLSLEHRRNALRALIAQAGITGHDGNLAVIGSALLRDLKAELRTSHEQGSFHEYVTDWLDVFGLASRPHLPTAESLNKRRKFHDKYDYARRR
ncbi:hypothetical protein ACFV4K_12040 [Nocardia sp. NPDC059764]|uniref:hypothetical protein n=1 Tax=Nocardia sp. NPDC059764 TaxID=3346939 RepID=UPI003647FB04